MAEPSAPFDFSHLDWLADIFTHFWSKEIAQPRLENKAQAQEGVVHKIAPQCILKG
jgi:hypothetical protein